MVDMEPQQVTVTALHPDGSVKARWDAVPLAESDGWHLLAARWSRPAAAAGPLRFEPGDILLECYGESAWYNVFAVWDGRRREPRGFYVNLSTPVRVRPEGSAPAMSYTDLALDFAVTRDQVVELDADAQGAALAALPEPDRAAARAAAATLRAELLAVTPAAAWQALTRRFERVLPAPGAAFLYETVGRWGVPAVYRGTLAFPSGGDLGKSGGDLVKWAEAYQRGERVAEAIFAIRLPGCRTLVHTKAFYPAGAFRLPGGGVRRGEAPVDAAVREAAEETGLATRPRALLAYAELTLVDQGGLRLPMPNYVFLLDPVDPEAPAVPAADEDIAELRGIHWQELESIARSLASLEGGWREWGIYRAIPHLLAHRAIAREHAWS